MTSANNSTTVHTSAPRKCAHQIYFLTRCKEEDVLYRVEVSNTKELIDSITGIEAEHSTLVKVFTTPEYQVRAFNSFSAARKEANHV